MNATAEKITISGAKKIVETAVQEHGDNLDSALDCLNQLTQQEVEFPTAINLVLGVFSVSQDDLTTAYDDQF